ncbi:MAG: amidohydrolase family protein [Brachybacterium sp.]|uniref:metal-dependent hydrolase family protein n=1 Tax=unclassified Brachybacterium TaxID=2623841 RepID=UPI003F8DEEA9
MRTPFALTDICVVTGDALGTIHQNWTISVDDRGTISYAGPADSADLPADGLRVDGRGLFVLPGLINAHAHLFADGRPLGAAATNPRLAKYATRLMHTPVGRRILRRRTREHAAIQLRSGVTTLRTVGDVAYEVVAIRDAIERGDIVGPRILPSGPLLAISGGHGAPQIALIADDPETARSHARQNIRRGAAAIKISATGGVTDAIEIGYAGKPEMPENSMRAICEEAHSAGVLVAAHAQSQEGALAALRAGVDTIEHGSSMSAELIELFLDNPASLRGYSALIPTLQACLPLVNLDPEVMGVDPVVRANADLVLGEMLGGIRAALENGIALGVGTDSSVSYVTHSNYWRELDLLQRVGGMEPAAVLHAATQGNARILGLDSVTGSIAVGKVADLVVVDADPLESFRNLAAPRMVIARGERIIRPQITRLEEIDRLLDGL